MTNACSNSLVTALLRSCRMYEAQWPSVGDVVMVKIKSVHNNVGAYVSLLEYGEMEGLIMTSELSKRHIQSISKLVRIGNIEAARVLRVDEQAGSVDLSKWRVSCNDRDDAESRYNKSKLVHSIVARVSDATHIPICELYERQIWPLYKRFQHAFNAFQLALTDPDILFPTGAGRVQDECDVSKLQSEFLCHIRHHMTPKATLLRCDLDVTCFSHAGVDGIRAALKAGESISTPDVVLKVRILSPPTYFMVGKMTTNCDPDVGIRMMQQACEIICREIQAYGGEAIVKNPPRIVQSEK